MTSPTAGLAAFPTLTATRHDGLTVFVRGLTLQAGIGIHDHEIGRLQTLIIDVSLDMGPQAVTRLADTVNYETIAEAARAIAAEGHIGLVESFAERLALAVLTDERVRRVTVRIEKPGALEGAVAPGCEVVFGR